MRLGVHLVSFATPGGPAGIPAMLAGLGAAAEEAGVDNLSLMDHCLQMEFLGGGRGPDARGLHHPRVPGRAHLARSSSSC